MKTSHVIAATLLATIAIAARPAPVEIDTPSAHIIVVRPVDVWSGDAGALEKSLGVVRARKWQYQYESAPVHFKTSGITLFGGPSKDPVIGPVAAELERRGFSTTSSLGNFFSVRLPVALAPASYGEFKAAQALAYRRLVVAEGDPDLLQRAVAGKKFAGSLLALLTVGVAGDKFGSVGAGAALNSTIPGDAYHLPLGVDQAFAPAALPDLAASEFKQLDVYRVVYGGDVGGQVIVAYKADRTPEAANDALIHAIVTLVGADTTPEAIEQSRAEDLAYRKKVWAECVASGEGKAREAQ